MAGALLLLRHAPERFRAQVPQPDAPLSLSAATVPPSCVATTATSESGVAQKGPLRRSIALKPRDAHFGRAGMKRCDLASVRTALVTADHAARQVVRHRTAERARASVVHRHHLVAKGGAVPISDDDMPPIEGREKRRLAERLRSRVRRMPRKQRALRAFRPREQKRSAVENVARGLPLLWRHLEQRFEGLEVDDLDAAVLAGDCATHVLAIPQKVRPAMQLARLGDRPQHRSRAAFAE